MHKSYTLPSIGIENLLKKSWPKVNYANIEMVKKRGKIKGAAEF